MAADPTPDEFTAALAAALAHAAQPCLMCGTVTDGGSCFAPDDSQLWGAPPGKQRLIFFALCSSCFVSTTPEQREAQIERWMRRAA